MTRARCTQAAIVLLIVMATMGCRSMTGQTFGANVDDATTTAAVKAKLVADHPRDLTAVDVDTVAGTVYLKGFVGTQAQKDRATQLARSVSGVRGVVNNLQIGSAATTSPSASASTGFGGMHAMTGQVTSVDPASGRLGLKTDAGDLQLHFPPPSLSNVRVGDQVTVELGIKPAR